MSMNEHVLVLGNGPIGQAISQHLGSTGVRTSCAGRSWNQSHQGSYTKVFFEAENPETVAEVFNVLKPTRTIIAFGKGGIRECKQNVQATREVNVNATLEILRMSERLYGQTLFFSSSLVWDLVESSMEKGTKVPRTEYGVQRLSVETAIKKQNLSTRIVRLGKVISENSKLIEKIKAVYERDFVQTFYTNLVIAPVHMDSIVKIIQLWLTAGLNRETNLVPRRQWSEVEIVKLALEKTHFYEQHFRSEHLDIAEDELPTQVFCPNEELVSPFGIYGSQAVEREIMRFRNGT